ncbi:TIM barrel protein [Shewanella sp. 125m-7]
MLQLANITVTPKPGHLFDNWKSAGEWLNNMNLSGFEIYPHGVINAKDIPSRLVGGFHLQSFPILTPLLYNDRNRLMTIFGDWQTVEQFYGGTDAEHIVKVIISQLNLAASLNAPYVVFHPMDCDMEHLFSQQFPWSLEDTLTACSELLNLALSQSKYKGWLLFENMWWKQSFRLDSRREYDDLRARVNYSKCGICFDTGHMMSTTSLANEADGISFLLNRLRQLDLNQEIKTLHLNSNLSDSERAPLKSTRKEKDSSVHTCYQECHGFWEQFNIALKHITHLDPHNGFKSVELSPLVAAIEPDYLVHEVSQKTLFEWSRSINIQRSCITKLQVKQQYNVQPSDKEIA